MPRKGVIVPGWLVRCSEPKCKAKLAFDTTLAIADNTLKSLGWKHTASGGWRCKEHSG